LPTLVKAGVVVQAVIPAVPEIDQVVVPVGGTPVLPVTASVNVIVELNEPPPLGERSTVGVTLEITTLIAEVAAKAVKLASPL